MLGLDLVMKIFLFLYLFIDPFFLILHTKGYFNMNPTHILNETSKPPVNKTHFFNIAHLLLNCLKLYLTQYI